MTFQEFTEAFPRFLPGIGVLSFSLIIALLVWTLCKLVFPSSSNVINNKGEPATINKKKRQAFVIPELAVVLVLVVIVIITYAILSMHFPELFPTLMPPKADWFSRK